jgi:hypothetical protein
MDWFANNPSQNAGSMQGALWRSHVFGRQQFAKSYARGGMAATVFAPTRKEMLISPWRTKHDLGSSEYMARLQKLQKLHPNDLGIRKAIASGTKGKPAKFSGFGTVGGMALGAYYIGEPALSTNGDSVDRIRAVGSGAASYVGWEVGSKVGGKLGLGIGASVGSYIMPGIGTAIGAGVGGLIGYVGGGLVGAGVGEKAYSATLGIPDRMVQRERARRKLDWGGHTAAFQTQAAHTMRQQALALMNRGAMSSRSLMGQEAVFVHR